MRGFVGSRASLLALGALRSATELAATSPGPDWRLRWRELGNKLEAFESFRRAEQQARGAGRGLSLAALVEHACPLAGGRTVWMLEGLAYGYAECQWALGAPREPLGWLAGLPAGSLIALHCGAGLSLARHRLAGSARLPPAVLRRGMADHLAACRELAWPGHAPALLEAMGFIARLRFARRAREVADALARLDEEAHACFWHGWGRALYFLPSHALPSTGGSGKLLLAVRGAPAGECRDNALAGLALALTLVNLRHPQVLAELLHRRGGELGVEDPAFAHGVGSAILVWHDCVPDDPWLARWRGYRPVLAGSELAWLWERQVSGPAETALAGEGGRVPIGEGLGDLFRYRARSPGEKSGDLVAEQSVFPARRADASPAAPRAYLQR
ncbi:MAG TPA: hypothetical protein VE075_07485 [Thermoanaerobaculia bacterium]|nr:hypothetical protein [Thermoanaerobaculia bacterium]